MLVQGLLEIIKARALLRDVLGAAAAALSLLGLFFLVYGFIDYLFPFSRPVRFCVSLAAGIAALAGIAAAINNARRRDALWAASTVERVTGAFDNDLVAVAESFGRPSLIAPYMRERLEAALAVKLSMVRATQVISVRPSRKVLLVLAQVVLSYFLLFILLPAPAKEGFRRVVLLYPGLRVNSDDLRTLQANSSMEETNLFQEMRIILTPPEYTRRAATEQIDKGEILALPGTRAEVIIKTGRAADEVILSVDGSNLTKIVRSDDNQHRASFVIKEASSYKVTIRREGESESGWEAIYGIKTIVDRAPEVQLNRPASDMLFLPGQAPASLPVRVRARDEFGVGSIRLKYIKATGEGDASRFESGQINIHPAAAGTGEWSGALSLDLGKVGLAPGVTVVLQAEATDKNVFTGPSTGYSENIILQVAEPEKVRIEVDNLGPDEVLKFLTSQRMILIKTERLHRLRNRISSQELLSRSGEIAFEQRRFRESFNEFTELEGEHDHEREAEQAESDSEKHNAVLPEIPAGASERVRSMTTAIRAMWRAETELQLANTATAIEFEKVALSHLKNAQKGLRHITLIAARSKSIDLKRRYQGRLDEIRDSVERVNADSQGRTASQLTPILTGIYKAARTFSAIDIVTEGSTGRVEELAQRIDRIAEDLLKVRDMERTSLAEPASKLKLVSRLVADSGKNRGLEPEGRSIGRQKVLALVADVCVQIAALAADRGTVGTSVPALNLSPSAASKGAAYYKLLSKPGRYDPLVDK